MMQITPTTVNRNVPIFLSLIYQSAQTCFQESLFSKRKQSHINTRSKSILVIDDNLVNHIVIKMITKKWDNTLVDFAVNGKEGLKKLSRKKYDVVLMDLQMPVMDGYETALAIRRGKENEKFRNIPIIALSSDTLDGTKDCILQIGINEHLDKPVSEEMLLECINSVVKI